MAKANVIPYTTSNYVRKNDLPRPKADAKLLTIKETAAFLNTSSTTVDRLMHAGRLPIVWVGKRRYCRPADLDAWINKGGARLPRKRKTARG